MGTPVVGLPVGPTVFVGAADAEGLDDGETLNGLELVGTTVGPTVVGDHVSPDCVGPCVVGPCVGEAVPLQAG